MSTIRKKQEYPEPTVGGLIFDTEGNLFLMQSHKWKGAYVIPGGHIELGETMIEALYREIKEETNLDIMHPKLICTQEFIFGKTFYESKRHYIFFDFSCQATHKNVIMNEEGHSPIWVQQEEALKLNLEPYTKKALEIFMAQE